MLYTKSMHQSFFFIYLDSFRKYLMYVIKNEKRNNTKAFPS